MPDDKMRDEDKALFRDMMQSVKPLGQSKKLGLKDSPPPEKTPLIKKSYLKANDDEPTSSFNLSNHYTTVVNSDSILSYRPSVYVGAVL
jgi:DNA-nicking Smr family endonuclease